MESFGEQRALILGYAEGRCASWLWRQRVFMGSILQLPRSQWLAGYCVQSEREQKVPRRATRQLLGANVKLIELHQL